MSKQNKSELVNSAKVWLEKNSSKKRKATINDVAMLAGVSKKTVSRVINNATSVSDLTRETVQAVIEVINYRPDSQARGLASKHSFLIGLIYDNPNPQYIVNVQQGVLDELKGTDFELVVHPCERHSPRFLEDAKLFIERQKLRGVILTPSVSEDEKMATMLRQLDCSYVRIASVTLDEPKHMLVSNDIHGGTLVARHLCELNHTDIAFIAGKKGFRSAEERRKGFELGLAEYGLTLDEAYVVQGEYTFESGLAAASQLLEKKKRPTAIFAANDEMAAGVMQAMRMHELRAPDDISVVGYDDFQLAQYVWPRLTTVHSPTREIGRLAAHQLLTMDTSDSHAPESTPWLVERESSGPPRTS